MNETVFENFPVLRTKRLLLRQVRDDDLQMIFDFNSDTAALRFVPRAPFETQAEAVEKIKGFRNGFADRKGIWWVFETRETDRNTGHRAGETIGYGGLFEVDAANSKAEIGYGLLPHYWGKGFVSEAIAEISRFGCDEFGLHRIYGQVDPENAPSARVLLKLGYVNEGCLKDDIFARGRYFDMDVFALINLE
ncbi:MAG: GNAT family N-acetyltransferase, partial [Gemmatimonadales bacterium]|nr:GNAT family N-acetyltransferase [Gemmatimonadales bacterium]